MENGQGDGEGASPSLADEEVSKSVIYDVNSVSTLSWAYSLPIVLFNALGRRTFAAGARSRDLSPSNATDSSTNIKHPAPKT